jgi:Iap family predicted aminopeptidase
MRLGAAELARTLDDVDRLGNRYHGTEGEQRCRDYILQQFEAVGLERVRLEPFRYLAYEHVGAKCAVLAPELQDLMCRAVQYTANAEVEGEAVYVGTGTAEDFERIDALGVDLAGKVIVAHSIAPFMIAPFLSGRGIAALVNVGETPDGLVGNFTAALYRPPLEPPWEGRPVEYPGVTIEATAGRALISTMTAGTPVRIRVASEARYVEKDSWNVVGELPGATDEQVIVGGHYDSQAEGSGVWDNGTGIAATIEIGRVLAGRSLRRGVVCACWAVEEVGLWGSTAYTVAHADELAKVVGMVNLDAIASRYPAKRTIWTDEAMEAFAVECARGEGWEPEVVFDARQFQFSDNSPFTDAGVPACWVWEFPPIHPYYHSSGDTRDLVDPDKLAATAGVSGRIVERLATSDVSLGRARTP